MFKGSGMIHKRSYRITYGRMARITGLGGNTEIRQAKARGDNIKKFDILFLYPQPLPTKGVKNKIDAAKHYQHQEENINRSTGKMNSQLFQLAPCFIFIFIRID